MKIKPTTASIATRQKAARDAGVEPVEKPPKRVILSLERSDVISLMLIRIAPPAILSPIDGLLVAWPSSGDVAEV